MNRDKIEELHHQAYVVLRASENWHTRYLEHKHSFHDLLWAESHLEMHLRAYFKGLYGRIGNLINMKEYRKRVIKAYDVVVKVDATPFQDEINITVDLVTTDLVQAALSGAAAAAEESAKRVGLTELKAGIQDAIDAQVEELASGMADTTRQLIEDSLKKSIALGETDQEAAARLKPVIDNEARALRIARTESVKAYSAGIQAFGIQSGATEKAWHTVPGACPICMALEGEVVGIDENFSSGDDAPPAHPNAILPNQEVQASDVAAKMVAMYHGDAVYLTTEGGVQLAVTPKHPVATLRGWVSASELEEGDYLLSATSWVKDMSSVIKPECNPVISLIEDVIVTGDVVSRVMPAAAIYFHGDAVSCEDINIVYSKSKLGCSADGQLFKSLADSDLGSRDIRSKKLVTFSPLFSFLNRCFSSLSRSMSRSSLLAPIFSGQGSHSNKHGLGESTQGDIKILEDIGNSLSADAMLFGKLHDRFPGAIVTDKLVSIEIKHYDGLVYDMSTEYQLYTCNTILVHNCRCSMSLIYPSGREEDQS